MVYLVCLSNNETVITPTGYLVGKLLRHEPDAACVSTLSFWCHLFLILIVIVIKLRNIQRSDFITTGSELSFDNLWNKYLYDHFNTMTHLMKKLTLLRLTLYICVATSISRITKKWKKCFFVAARRVCFLDLCWRYFIVYIFRQHNNNWVYEGDKCASLSPICF